MKKILSFILVLTLLSSICLVSCAQKSVSTVNVKIQSGKSSTGETKDFKADETIYDGTVEIEVKDGEKLTVNDILNYLNNNAEGVTCEYSDADGTTVLYGINGKSEKREQVDQYISSIGQWRFVVNNVALKTEDTVENGSTLMMYYVSWESDSRKS